MRALLALACLALGTPPVFASGGRLLATGGATQVEGSAGGGLVPWAVLAGYGTRDQHGGTAFATHVDTGDYRLDVQGAAYTFGNRLELSFARQRLDLGTLQDQLALPWATLDQDVFGAKLRLAGDLVYTRMPQVSVGVQYKRLHDDALPLAVGARDGAGIHPDAARQGHPVVDFLARSQAHCDPVPDQHAKRAVPGRHHVRDVVGRDGEVFVKPGDALVVNVDGGEGGTGAAPLAFSDHVALPFKLAMSRVYPLFARAGLAEDVVFIGTQRGVLPNK